MPYPLNPIHIISGSLILLPHVILAMKKQALAITKPLGLDNLLNVILSDRRNLQAIGHGDIVLKMNLPHGKIESYTLYDVLLVPELAYNLLSVISASKKEKVTTFSEMRCEIRDSKFKPIAMGHREGSLYSLDHNNRIHQAYVGSDCKRSTETMWHHRFVHLGVKECENWQKVKW